MLSDQALLSILKQSSDATAIYDSADLHIRFVNDAMLKIWGKEKNVLYKTLNKALPELNDQPFEGLLKRVWQSGQPYSAKEMMATLDVDGESKTSYFDFEYRPLLDAQGNTYAILHTARDVSSHVQAWQQITTRQQREQQLIEQLTASDHDVREMNDHLSRANRDLHLSNENITRLNERLKESETDFRRLVEQAPVAILVFRGADLVIDLANKVMLEILGKDLEIIGQPLLKGLPEIEGAPAVNMLFDVFNLGKSYDGIEEPVPIMRNGILETRYFNFAYRPLLDNGRIVGVMDVAVEVTEQVAARKHLEDIITEKTNLEQVLRANEQRLQGILDTMAEGVIIVDAACKPTYANPMAQKIFGVTENGFKDRTYNDEKWENQHIDGTPLAAEDHPMNVTLRTGIAVYDEEVAVQLPSAPKIYISINAAPLINEQGNIIGAIATFTDVTNRRMILQQKDDFISVASHELKTPITSLVAALQLLESTQANVSEALTAELIAQANRSVTKLRNLVNSLLNSNRIILGRFPINKKHFKLSHLINECCQHIRAAGTHQVVIEGNMELKVEADEQLIDQVVINLLNNAMKYAPASGKIDINIQQQQNEAMVSVADFGPGISTEKLPHLFGRYYQGEQLQNGSSGLGLGLYISAEIIKKHGGQIGVESRLGEGSRFWFTLPL